MHLSAAGARHCVVQPLVKANIAKRQQPYRLGDFANLERCLQEPTRAIDIPHREDESTYSCSHTEKPEEANHARPLRPARKASAAHAKRHARRQKQTHRPV